jgi:plasmid maintenance system killer protein
MEEIKKHKGLNFEKLLKPEHSYSIRMSKERRIFFDFQDMKFILKI